MLRIRLSRVGRKHDPSYRMIVTEKGRAPQTGNYVEQVGTYDARSDEHSLKDERISYWLSVGAQPSDTVHNLLVKAGILDAPTVNPLPKKSPIVSEEPEEESVEADEAGEDSSDNEDDEVEEGSAEAEDEESDDEEGEEDGEDEDEE